eukprot:jgi/Botrbrau1/4267/Bobra.0390s0007.1
MRIQKPEDSQSHSRQRGAWALEEYSLILVMASLGIFLVVMFVLWEVRQAQTGTSDLRYNRPAAPSLYHATVVQSYPHDPTAFTQGLEYDLLCPQGPSHPQTCTEVFWESTGMYGKSTVRLVNLTSGTVVRRKDLPPSDFGEGLVKWDNRLYQILWQTNKAYNYAADNFDDRREMATPLRDGWGLTKDSQHIIISDGSDVLTWLDPTTLQKVRSVQVKDGMRSVRNLNELEYINGEVWANIWQTECIARINPDTGVVTGWILLLGLREKVLKESQDLGVTLPYGMDVLNGIAYDATHDSIYITGKYWPRVYKIELDPGYDVRPAQVDQARAACITS